MRGLVTLAVVAAAAFVSGRRQGRVEGQITGITQSATAFAAGIIRDQEHR